MTRLTLRAAALLLDMDGTLVHSTDEVETVWRLWCRRHQLAPEPVLAMCHGLRSRERRLSSFRSTRARPSRRRP